MTAPRQEDNDRPHNPLRKTAPHKRQSRTPPTRTAQPHDAGPDGWPRRVTAPRQEDNDRPHDLLIVSE
ncbi:protein of unknown function [Streptantibioticus cattleyicolor NRRL 8057 = DSM 46488]|nr:protein of unknown function [Streptantibioticus cattleyicolor NRRL 8057 = DSM 46488]